MQARSCPKNLHWGRRRPGSAQPCTRIIPMPCWTYRARFFMSGPPNLAAILPIYKSGYQIPSEYHSEGT